jgi:uncharacterized protein
MEFEWDEEKRRTNLTKHKIDFEDAAIIFTDPEALTVTDLRHVEPRLRTTGAAETTLLTVVWTPRGSSVRMISARSASRAERRDYRSALGRRTEGEKSTR